MKIVIHQIKTHIEQTLTKREIAKKIKLSENCLLYTSDAADEL